MTAAQRRRRATARASAGPAPAIGYCRVSSGGQATEGVSLEAQRARIEAWAAMHGRELADVYVDAGLSGCRADNRPALQAAIEHACRTRGALVVYSLSRLARSTRDCLDLSARLDTAGADLVSLSEQIDTTTAAGRMIFRLLAVLAEFERDLISERTTGALAHLRHQRRRTSRDAPYGWRVGADGSALEPVPEEAAAVDLVRSLSAAGVGPRAICRELATAGHLPRSGGAWHPETVRRIVAYLADVEGGSTGGSAG